MMNAIMFASDKNLEIDLSIISMEEFVNKLKGKFLLLEYHLDLPKKINKEV